MNTSKEFKTTLQKLQSDVLSSIEKIVAGRKLDLNRPIIFVSHDDGESNEVIVSINPDMTTDTEFNYDIAEGLYKVDEFPIHIQIGILEALENEEFEECE